MAAACPFLLKMAGTGEGLWVADAGAQTRGIGPSTALNESSGKSSPLTQDWLLIIRVIILTGE